MVYPVLKSLDAVVNKAVFSARDACLNEGLRQLPDEVLGLIIRWASFASYGDRFGSNIPPISQTTIYKVMRLSHVCSRFRKVILSSPSLCATLDTRVPVSLLWLFINRAGLAPLTVHLVSSFSGIIPERQNATLDVIMKYHARWQDVFIWMDHPSNFFSKILRYSATEKLQLPSLRYIRLLNTPGISSPVPTSVESVDLLSTWNYPSSVYVERVRGSRILVPSSLLNATYMDVDLRDRPSIASFKQNIFSMSRLEKLDVKCSDPHANNARRPIGRIPGSQVGYMSNLTDLALDILSVDMKKDTFHHHHPAEDIQESIPVMTEMNFLDLVALLPLWQLTTLSFNSGVLSSFESIIAQVGVFENLEKLELELRAILGSNCDFRFGGERDDDAHMENWCDAMPKLKSLSFKGFPPPVDKWINSKTGEFVFKRLTTLREIRFFDYGEESEGRNLAACIAEAIAKAWTEAVPNSLSRKLIVVNECTKYDLELASRLRNLGVDVV